MRRARSDDGRLSTYKDMTPRTWRPEGRAHALKCERNVCLPNYELFAYARYVRGCFASESDGRAREGLWSEQSEM